MKKSLIFVLFVSLSFLLTLSCEDENSTSEIKDQLIASVFPDIGTNTTRFQPNVLINNDDTVAVGTVLQYRCDYDNDGVPETEWLDTIPKTATFSTFGKHTLKIHVKDDNGTIDSTTIDVHVQELIQITQTNTTGDSDDNIDWSRDGTNRIAFERRVIDQHLSSSIFVLNYLDGTMEQVSFNPDTDNEWWYDSYPEWSPDGSKIACYSTDGLNVIDLNSGQRTLLTKEASSKMLSWSPDGRWLFYWSSHGETAIYDFDNNTVEIYSDNLDHIAWSPDGSKIAAYSWEKPTLRIIEFSSGNVLSEFIVPYVGEKLDWSPDGRWISLGFDYQRNVFLLLDYETGTLHSWLPGHLTGIWYPSWSEDGSMLAFEAMEEIEGTRTWKSIWAIKFPEEME